jgi:LysM repeat protein
MRKLLSISVLVLIMLILTGAVAQAKPNEWTTICNHVVQHGETIYCIARAYGVDPWTIASYNGVVNPNRIYPGQVLEIPDAYAAVPAGPTCAAQCGTGPTPSCTCAHNHTVVAGENLYRISLHYGVSMWRVAECNHILNLNYVRTGDTLCIPAP